MEWWLALSCGRVNSCVELLGFVMPLAFDVVRSNEMEIYWVKTHCSAAQGRRLVAGSGNTKHTHNSRWAVWKYLYLKCFIRCSEMLILGKIKKNKKTTEMVTVSFAHSTLVRGRYQRRVWPTWSWVPPGASVCAWGHGAEDSRAANRSHLSLLSHRASPYLYGRVFLGDHRGWKTPELPARKVGTEGGGGRTGGAWPGDTDAASNCKSKQMKGGET